MALPILIACSAGLPEIDGGVKKPLNQRFFDLARKFPDRSYPEKLALSGSYSQCSAKSALRHSFQAAVE
jgi:hypothetical protein